MPAHDDYDTAMQGVATALGTDDFTTARKQLRVAGAHALRIPATASGEGVTVQARALADIETMTKLVDDGERRVGKWISISNVWVPE